MEHAHSQHSKSQQSGQHQAQGHYPRLLVMAGLSFVAMYVLMYAMVDRLDNVYNNLNQFYMAGLMAAPMVLIELLLMRGMYPNRRMNAIILVTSVALGILFWILLRQQGGITDRQFLRSMIPHHAGAVLMCEQRRAQDPRIRELCGQITSSQNSEIRLMESILAEGDGRSPPDQ